MRAERGQVLAFFALVLPMMLVPVAGYAVDAAVLSSTAANLQAAVAEAAEAAADQIDVTALRAYGHLVLDPVQVRSVAVGILSAEEPDAVLVSVAVAGAAVTIAASERVMPVVPLWSGSLTLRARASARLVSGYDSPSSHLALPLKTF